MAVLATFYTKNHVSYSMTSSKRMKEGITKGTVIAVIKGDARSLDCRSFKMRPGLMLRI